MLNRALAKGCATCTWLEGATTCGVIQCYPMASGVESQGGPRGCTTHAPPPLPAYPKIFLGGPPLSKSWIPLTFKWEFQGEPCFFSELPFSLFNLGMPTLFSGAHLTKPAPTQCPFLSERPLKICQRPLVGGPG